MGKHKEKSKKRKDKKSRKKEKRKYSSSSSSDEEWVEKKTHSNSSADDERVINKDERKRKYSSSSEEEYRRNDRKGESFDEESAQKRDDWMALPTNFLTSLNSHSKRNEKQEERRLERERQQYNPRECARELNPYWKDGGDGLPKFKKPESDDEDDRKRYEIKQKSTNKTPSWKKAKETREQPSDKNARAENKMPESSADTTILESDLNVLAANLVKAEIMGNTKLVNELKEKLENARKSRSTGVLEEAVILTHTDSKGRSQPVKLLSQYGESSGEHKRKKKVETHKDRERVRYFADDDKYSLKQMFEDEKYNSVEDQNSEFIKMAGSVRKNDDLDDVFTDSIRHKESDSKTDTRNRDRAIQEHQRISKSLDNCNRCIQSVAMPKHLMISMGETTYLALPPYEPLTEGHSLIIPIRHVPCSTQLDENEWSDILDMRRSLVNLFKSKNEDVIFFETAMGLHRFIHMYIECIPLPREEGDLAPIYFKKAIEESEIEWTQNKKLISLKGRDVRKAVPKGLAYFAVSFGMEEGFAHVIEDEKLFPANFAQEIIGGMLDLHHSKWRKPKMQSFDEQSKRVLKFSAQWKEFDCTV